MRKTRHWYRGGDFAGIAREDALLLLSLDLDSRETYALMETAILDHPELVQRLVLSHARATDHLKANPKEWLKRASTFGTPLQILEKAAPNMELAWHMDADFVRKARALGERMQALRLIERQPDYDGLFDLSFVNKVGK